MQFIQISFSVTYFLLAQFPLQCTGSGIGDGECHIPFAFTIHSQKESGGGFPVAVYYFFLKDCLERTHYYYLYSSFS